MNEWIPPSGELRSIPTETGGDTGTGGGAAGAAERETGAMAAGLKSSAGSGRSDTGKGRKKTSDPLPVSDAMSIFQEAIRMLQESGVLVQAVNLPVSPGARPRVAILVEGAMYDTGKLFMVEITTG